MSKPNVEALRPTQYALPEELTVITDPTHPLFDPGYATVQDLPDFQALKASIADQGVIEPVIVRRDGDKLEIINGRKRHKATTEVNKARAKEGAEPFKLPVRVMKVGDDVALASIVYAANIHVSDPPLIRAQKVAHAVNKLGMSKDQVALAMGAVTKQAVDNWLALLDCSVKVQTAVKEGKIAETVARQFAGMERAQQDKTLNEMVEKGVTTGSVAVHAVRRAKKGKSIPDKPKRGAGKSRSRGIIEAILEHLENYPKPPAAFAVLIPYTKYLLGDNTVRESMPDEVLECIAAAMGDLK